MFRIYSGIDQSAHLQRVQVWFEITDRFCVEVNRNSIFLQDYKHIKLLGLLKREYYLCWSLRSVWINEVSSDVWIQWCQHEVSIYPSVVPVNWYQYIYYSDDMHRLWIPVLKWNNTPLLFEAVCYKKHSVSENSYPRRGIFSSGSPVYMPIVERSVLV